MVCADKVFPSSEKSKELLGQLYNVHRWMGAYVDPIHQHKHTRVFKLNPCVRILQIAQDADTGVSE